MSGEAPDSLARMAVFQAFGASPEASLAFEEELLAIAATGHPALSLSSWAGPVAVLGYGQPTGDIDLEACRVRGIPVLRRITGGTGVIHAGDLAISLALPASHPWAASITGLYDRFLSVLTEALALSGAIVERPAPPAVSARRRSSVCFEDWTADTLTVNGRKAVGCAQARRKASVLIHAAVLLGLNPRLYAIVFRVSATRIREALAPVSAGLAPRELARDATQTLGSALGLEPHPHDPSPISERFLDRYRHPRWAPVPQS